MDKSASEKVADETETPFVNDVSVRTFFSLGIEKLAVQK